MDSAEINDLLAGQYTDNANSNPVKVLLEDGNIICGQFIKAMQFKHNMKFNVWIISSLKNEDVVLKGEMINSIQPA